MARFKDLPAELQLSVAEHLANGEKVGWNYTSNSKNLLIQWQPFQDLRALALVCRELASTAQDVLFRSPVVSNGSDTNWFSTTSIQS